mgnify:CR=1 FL=1
MSDPLTEVVTLLQPRMAHFMLPRYVRVLQELPRTPTQKVQKHQLFSDGVDPRTAPGVIDLRHWKKRDKPRTH